MFGKKVVCAVCGEKLSNSMAVQIGDGVICYRCRNVCNESPLAMVNDVKSAWEENHRRWQMFEDTNTMHSFGSGFIHVDVPHKLVYFSAKKTPNGEPIIFSFDEVKEYSLEIVGQKTVTKTKGGVGRAVVGGALFGGVGAIVGASTAKQETKTTGGTNFLNVTISLKGMTTKLSLCNPPLQCKSLFNSIMAE